MSGGMSDRRSDQCNVKSKECLRGRRGSTNRRTSGVYTKETSFAFRVGGWVREESGRSSRRVVGGVVERGPSLTVNEE